MDKTSIETFHNKFFPYSNPYNCQQNFMHKLFEVLSVKTNKAGIFESPTGTGKSLSLLCGVLKYLDEISSTNNIQISDISDDWLSNFGNEDTIRLNTNTNTNTNTKNYNGIKNEVNFKRKFGELKPLTQKNHIDSTISSSKRMKSNCESPDRMVIDETVEVIMKNKLLSGLPSTSSLLHQFPIAYSNTNIQPKLQIFYCTRTHSQISQVISEIKKINNCYYKKFGSRTKFSFTGVGSRKLLCINKKVNSAGRSSHVDLNEKCLELIGNSSCEYYNLDLIESLSSEIQTNVYDIEELYKLGDDIGTCPYFSSRKAFDSSDIVVLPYNFIISSKIRKSLNINLENKIVIFDEAHNLIDNILQTYNSEISFDEVYVLLFGFNLYYEKYKEKLKPSSGMYLRQIVKILESILSFLNTGMNQNISSNLSMSMSHPLPLSKTDLSINKIYDMSELLIDLEISNFNFFTLVNFFEIAELHKKIKWTIENYLSSIDDFNNSPSNQTIIFSTIVPRENITSKNIKTVLYSNSNLLNEFLNLLNGFTYLNDDAKIVVESCPSVLLKNQARKLKFVLVNPSREFDYVIKNVKKIILAGGTMKPLEEFRILLQILKQEEIQIFEGSHVVNKNNLLVANITTDEKNTQKLVFNHENFKNNEVILLSAILNIVRFHLKFLKGGKGIVAFVHNYSILQKIKEMNNQKLILNNIEGVTILFEEKDCNSNIFHLYQDYINVKKHNTVLFAVVGGKLSEGINFSDDLARIVLIFGLPYPNISSLDLKAKMNYYDQIAGTESSSSNTYSYKGVDYYENLCMKAVNQSIGRSIRHKDDYAIIVFVDERYDCSKIKNKLPKWILDAGINVVNSTTSFNEYTEKIVEFFHKSIEHKYD